MQGNPPPPRDPGRDELVKEETRDFYNTHNAVCLFLLILLQKLVANPCLIIDGISRFDFGQGILGKTSLFIPKTPSC